MRNLPTVRRGHRPRGLGRLGATGTPGGAVTGTPAAPRPASDRGPVTGGRLLTTVSPEPEAGLPSCSLLCFDWVRPS